LIETHDDLRRYEKRINKFHAYRFEPKIGTLYGQVWDKINALVSNKLLTDKIPVVVKTVEGVKEMMAIHTATELQMMGRSEFLDKSFIFGRLNHDGQCMPVDINLACTRFWSQGKGFKPIGEQDDVLEENFKAVDDINTGFRGICDGNDSHVYGLWANDFCNDQGLLGYVDNAILNNLDVNAFVIGMNEDDCHNGVVVGNANEYNTIEANSILM